MKLLIRNALICDGTGSPVREGDLLAEDGFITTIGRDLPDPGAEILDADHRLLTPGFLDVHAHSDLSILAAPDAPGKIAQGVTTEISGNCGLSPWPVLTDEVREHLNDLYRTCNVPVTWSDFASYADAVDRARPAVNQAALCGHNTLRACFSGYGNRTLKKTDLLQMKEVLSRMLAQGAAGFSTGLLYTPGCFSTPEETAFLASALRDTGKVYATHLRSEGKRLLESMEEAFLAASAGSGKIEISHWKTAGKDNWHKLPDALRLVRETAAKGLQIHADRYPYTRAMTSLSVILPPPYDRMPDREIRDQLAASPKNQKALEKELVRTAPQWDDILLTSTGNPLFAGERGKTIQEIARNHGMTPERLCVILMAGNAPDTMAAFHGLSDENLNTILRQDMVCCGTDETTRPPDGSLGWSHPRGYGSFPEFFRIVSALQGIPEAVRRMTSLPAQFFRLEKRGLLKEGYAADMVLMDPDRYRSKADFSDPHAAAEGICGVWVGGRLAWDGREVTCRAGRMLRIR